MLATSTHRCRQMYNSLCNSSDKITLFVLPTTAGVKYADLDLKMCQQLIVLRWIMDGGHIDRLSDWKYCMAFGESVCVKKIFQRCRQTVWETPCMFFIIRQIDAFTLYWCIIDKAVRGSQSRGIGHHLYSTGQIGKAGRRIYNQSPHPPRPPPHPREGVRDAAHDPHQTSEPPPH